MLDFISFKIDVYIVYDVVVHIVYNKNRKIN